MQRDANRDASIVFRINPYCPSQYVTGTLKALLGVCMFVSYMLSLQMEIEYLKLRTTSVGTVLGKMSTRRRCPYSERDDASPC